MKNKLGLLMICASMGALAACATTPATTPETVAPAAEPVAAPAPEKSAHDRLFDLFKASDEASLQRNPLDAIFRGDLRYADRLGDSITDEYYAAEKAAAESDIAGLHAIPRDQLDERLAQLGANRRDAGAVSGAMVAIIAGRAVAAGRVPATTEPLYLRSPDVTMPHGPKRVTAPVLSERQRDEA